MGISWGAVETFWGCPRVDMGICVISGVFEGAFLRLEAVLSAAHCSGPQKVSQSWT